MGDAFLALPAVRCLIEWFGSDKVVVWAPSDILETVYSDLSCARLSLNLSRYEGKLFVDEEEDSRRAVETLRVKAPLAWVSLNAYFPLWPIEESTRNNLGPIRMWGFGKAPEVFRQDSNGVPIHMSRQYFHVIGERAPEDRTKLHPNITRVADEHAASYLVSHFADPAPGFVAIHTDTESEKQWPRESWRALARQIQEQLGLSVLALGKPPADLLAESFILPPPEDWHAQVALLAKSRGFVGIDSVFAHIADALDIPGVALFGPTSAAEWGPTGSFMHSITAPSRDLKSIDPGEVVDALVKAGIHCYGSIV
jgi:hypothetical protein